MEERQAGVTALITAYSRAYHATHDLPRIFDDFLADQLFTPEEHTLFDQNLAGLGVQLNPDLASAAPDQALAWVMQTLNVPVTISRSRYTEDCLEAAIRQGVRQYVILGAGFDTFAFRRPDLTARVQVFEVDHPVTQALKRERIKTVAGWDLPPQLHFVPVDFTRDNLAETLQSSPYNPQELSFFSWQGVTYYLTREVIFATLRTLASIACTGSTIIFDYMDTESFDPSKAAQRTQIMHGIARQVGEPMKSGFDPRQLAGELAPVGLTLPETLSPSEIEARYFQGRMDAYHAFEHVHFARAIFA